MPVEAPVARSLVATSPMNKWILSQLPPVAKRLGIPEVYLEDPEFDFFGYVQNVFKGKGYRGLTVDEKSNETIQRLLFDMEKGGPGPVLRQYDGRNPFDAFFRFAVRRRVITELRDDKKHRDLLPTVNIAPSGKDEGTPGIAEETLEGGPLEGPNDEYLDQTVENMLAYLARARAGDLLSLVFRLSIPEPRGGGMNQKEVVDYLNKNEIPSETGQTTWSPGMLNSVKAKVQKVIEQYVRDENVGEGGEGILKPLMNTKPRAPQPKRSNEAIWYPNGQEPGESVRIIRQSPENTQFEKSDGTRMKVPTQHVKRNS